MDKKINPDKLYKQKFPYASKEIDDEIRYHLYPSFIMAEIDLETTDYAFMLHPVLKSLEGIIKQLLIENGAPYSKSFGSCIRQKNKQFYLTNNTRICISCNYTKNAILKLYTFYHTHRHTLFHMKDDLKTTRKIPKKQTAFDLMNDAFDAIEQSFKSIKLQKNLI